MTTSSSRPLRAVTLLFAALVAGQALRARPAAAQARDAAAGEALFQEGRRLMKNKEFAAACPKLDESYRLDPALGTLFNLAACEEELGRTASAWQHWRAVADQLPGTDKRRATAVARAGALEKLLARLAIAVDADAPRDTEVARDGVRLGAASLGVPLPVDPGKHQVVVSAPGREPREYEVTVRARESKTLTVEPGAPKPVAAAPPVDAAPPAAETVAPPRDTAGSASVELGTSGPVDSPAASSGNGLAYGLLAGGALALGAAGYAGMTAMSARNDAKKDCAAAGARVCLARGQAAIDRDKKYSLYADVAAGVGVVLAGAGLYFLLRGPGETAVSAQLAPRPDGGALQIAGRF